MKIEKSIIMCEISTIENVSIRGVFYILMLRLFYNFIIKHLIFSLRTEIWI